MHGKNGAIFFTALEQQAMRNIEIAESISNLYKAMKSEFASILASKWSVQALDFVFANPIFLNTKFTKYSDIPNASAARFTRALLDRGLLVTIREASGRRSAMYSFEPLMRLIRV